MKTRILIRTLASAAAVIAAGAFIWAAAAPGTQEDPFITLDYLVSVYKPQLLEEIRSAGAQVSQTVDARIAELEASLGPDQGADSPGQGSADRFSVVTLSRGQSLTCSVGTEIMLRIGTASGFGPAPALVNYTTGESLSEGSALTVNHMYLVTIEGNGVRAAADTVKVLARGAYTVN